MRQLLLPVTLSLAMLSAGNAHAGHIVADFSGLANPDQVVDFGSGLYPNFTPITTEFPPLTVSHASYFTTGSFNNLVGGFLTNDGSGGPTTLKIHFASPITDVSFVYHQIGASGPSVFRAYLAGFIVDTFTNFSDQFQPNNYFGFTGFDFDEIQIDFVSDFNLDYVAYNEHDAACTFRNGLGINPADYSCTSMPVLGSNWVGQIHVGPSTLGALVAVAPGGPVSGVPLFGGELLVQLAPPPLILVAFASGTVTAQIPATPAFAGVTLATQGIRFELISGTTTLVLSNALDLTLGD